MTLASPLPEQFWKRAVPIPVAAPAFVARNVKLADQLGLGRHLFDTPDALQALSGNAPWRGVEPVALAYSGHQYGGWNPTMGDGRAHLIATLDSGYELHLKGSGTTPFSRNGDGRAALGPMLREYILSEAMAGLGIPTTRSLAVVATGEQVYRRRREPGGILTRVAKSHVRVGTFEFADAFLGAEGVRQLYEHERARSHSHTHSPREFFASVVSRQAHLIAQWMSVGFIHGVMNTDNMSISGETIDFGPCAFMDVFHPGKVFSSIDRYGRYAWGQQPGIAQWNLTRLAESLLALFADDTETALVIAKSELAKFHGQFETAFETQMLNKLGITERRENDGSFIATILGILTEEKLDYTLFFRNLTRHQCPSRQALEAWRERLGGTDPDEDLMRANNPIYIPRNHQVEAALREAESGNLTRLETVVQLVQTPFTEMDSMADFEAGPLPDQEVTETFCGT